jgi:hypothetical protein
MTVAQFIEALGGTRKAAEIFDVGTNAVSNWRVWNRLPRRLHLKALREASARGIAFDPENPNPDLRVRESTQKSTGTAG